MQIQRGRLSIVLLMPFFISVCVSSPRGMIVFCAGDSLTAAAYPHFLQRILNRDGLPARVLNFGRSGNTSGEYLDFLVKNMERLIAERPDFILLQLGTNDIRTDLDFTPTERFRDNMKKILAAFRRFRKRDGRIPVVLLSTIPPVPSAGLLPFDAESLRRVEAEINPTIRALAAEEGIIVVDNHGLFIRRPDLLPDVHPSREGYRLLAENWSAALRPLLKRP
jgi:lysophospholipase L1-like esterase